MKQIRLLPVVIFAAVALLIFKGVGLVTQGGYVLAGTSIAIAAGDAHGGAPAGGETSLTPDGAIDTGPTMTDTSPVMEDASPTLPTTDAAAGGHGATAAEGEDATHGEAAPAAGEAAPADAPSSEGAPAEASAAIDPACLPADPAAAEGNAGHAAPGEGDAAAHDAPAEGEAAAMPADCPPVGDAIPMATNAQGEIVPLSELNGAASSEKQILERLSERRAELDTRESELTMRAALVEAAEKRLAERQAALEQLQAQVNALVDQKKAAEEEQFKALVSMYETMKPKEAALILNDLDINVLLRVARAMNPRKMAPIMARMVPEKAQALTVGLAADQPGTELAATPEDLAALPEIVGQ